MYQFTHPMVGHRAGGKLAPENTLAAFRLARDLGYKAVEFDVMLTHDGVPVINHDPVFGRTIPGPGDVGSTDLASFLQKDAGSWLDEKYAFEPPITLATALQFCLKFGIWMNIEIKPFPGQEAHTGAVVASFVAQHQVPVDQVLFSSFKRDALVMAHRVAPQYQRGYLIDDLQEDAVAFAKSIDAVALHVNHKKIDEAFVQGVIDQGLAVFAYTVNDVEMAQKLYSWGVQSMCTDQLALMKQFVA